MREILFRGKTADGDEWVSGFYAEYSTAPFIGTPNPQGTMLWFEVDPDTVGQYTGLTDKNGKRIFEGDIVHILGNQSVEDWKNVDYTALIAFLDGGFCALDGTIEEHGFRRYALARLDFDMEVIGNIHDNPELLEVEE